ncbi:hypothetical protein [Pseudomonas sp. BW7P1]|uniref:hypothetical protein n=1 Tax=Pseudomonas TaxID=286 RepID=UPI0021AD53F6|nr:hypothetical protein [Pseudomonas sp. BW7P1]UWI63582.1 hypothetical protein NWV16_09310 [Pseudomonas sp. BW7P1]
MSCTDSLATPVKKTRHQLLYLIYGNKDVYRREAKFSILTALSQAKTGKRPAIRVLTDRPQDYEGWPVDTVLLDEPTLTRWQGDHGYHHRRKACAIAAGLQLAEKTLFVDTDTLFTSDPNRLFPHITAGQSVMDRFEYDWKDVFERDNYLKLGRDLGAHGVTPANGFKLYNSGLCGVTDSDGALFEESIRLIDEWTADGFEIHTIEQIALSFAMRNRPVLEARRYIYHYFAEKRFFHAMQAFFFAQHGEKFSQRLVDLCKDVPRVKPFPSAWQRLKIKWKLRNQKGTMRKVGRDLLYGSAAPDHPYYSACRHEWWECASREILRWDEKRQKKLLNQSRWPQQLPRPEKPEDEKVIMTYLKKRVAAAR